MDLPDDMNDGLKVTLYSDVLLYGNCYYTETDDGYEHVDPVEAVEAEA